jgi:5-histidylcysteine sulfoxide synthase/putative 4-mercaptohistidine N1-methyltranferase
MSNIVFAFRRHGGRQIPEKPFRKIPAAWTSASVWRIRPQALLDVYLPVIRSYLSYSMHLKYKSHPEFVVIQNVDQIPPENEMSHNLLQTKTPLLTGDSPEEKRREILEYFNKTSELYDRLFDVLASDDVYFKKAIPLRHPLIFYYGHTAVFYINKLRVSKFIQGRLNAKMESLVAIGVDEMSWDDLDENNYNWPTVAEVRAYRESVKEFVCEFINSIEVTLPINSKDPLWIVMMGIEHERIHLETSSVLFRQLPIEDVRPDALWSVCPNSAAAPENSLIAVSAGNLRLGKDETNPIWGWDNEYGSHETNVQEFSASKYLVSNGEYFAFVNDNGYASKEFWCDEGWQWLQFSKVRHPEFWVPRGDSFLYRAMLEEIKMPWDWPVDVNCLEAKAFCKWLSKKQGRTLRLPTEDEWYLLRNKLDTDQPYWTKAPGNINLEHWCSACPVNEFEQIDGLYDIIGNVWQWTETPIYAFNGFKVHPAYDDFSTPTFDGKHNLIKGGCFISTGNYAIKDSRYAFRRHFFQHAGFRYIESESAVVDPTNIYETDDLISQYIEFHYGDEHYGVTNFAKQCADICLKMMKGRKKERALDLGCAVGRSTFELAREFDHVDGLDFSARFIQVAVKLQNSDLQRFVIPDEGDLVSYKETSLSGAGLLKTASRAKFMQSDACNLSEKYRDYDLVFAGNLVDRLYAPLRFLKQMATRIRPGGLFVITSPYTWLEDFTPRNEWIGGFKVNGENYTTLDALHDILGENFNPVGQPRDVPFVIRETARKFQHSVAQLTVWQRKV